MTSVVVWRNLKATRVLLFHPVPMLSLDTKIVSDLLWHGDGDESYDLSPLNGQRNLFHSEREALP